MGIRHSSGRKELSGTTPVELWKVTIGRKARIVKIMVYNPDTSDHVVELGEVDPSTSPPTWVSGRLVRIPVSAGQLIAFEESEIPREYVASKSTTEIRSWGARLGASVSASNVEISIEVEEE